jgi:hypothetical protein
MARRNGVTGMGAHQSATMLNDEWLTPPDIISCLGPFDLDPCAPVIRPWETAEKHFTIKDNGLLQPWDGYVWCNPPYGQETGAWLNRMVLHNNGISLIFARTETAMFVKYVWKSATSVLFLFGRIFFYYVDGSRAKSNSGAPSVLVAYGPKADEMLKFHEHNLKGKYIKLKL